MQSHWCFFAVAYTLLSSVSIRHHDSLLFGALPPSLAGSTSTNLKGTAAMPLFLEGLPKSCPLAGPLGLNGVAVQLQSAVLRHGFLVSW